MWQRDSKLFFSWIEQASSFDSAGRKVPQLSWQHNKSLFLLSAYVHSCMNVHIHTQTMMSARGPMSNAGNQGWEQPTLHRGGRYRGNRETERHSMFSEWQQWRLLIYLLSPIWLFCNPMDCSSPGSSVHGISQARILKWVAISFSRESSWPRDRTHVSCFGRRLLYQQSHHQTCSKLGSYFE